jgi:hypothetical protein
MKKNLRRLVMGLVTSASIFLGSAQAENWIPIGSGENLFFIPQIMFQATEQ